MRMALVLVLAVAAAAEDRTAARRLLDSVPGIAGAVQPETGVIAMWRAGAAYAPLDKAKAADYLSQAFAAAAALGEYSEQYRAGIVQSVAEISLPDAIEMLAGLREPATAADRIAALLVSKQEFDRAMDLLALTPESAEYPFLAAARVFEGLPAGDSRRTISFGRAVEAYTRRPSGPFADFVERCGKHVPPTLTAQAAAAISRRIADWKDDTSSLAGSLDEGPVEMHSPNQAELRNLMAVLRQIDAARADAIVKSRPDVAAALATFRKERKPAGAAQPEAAPKSEPEDAELNPPLMGGPAGDLGEFTRRMQEMTEAASKAEKVLATLAKDPRKAFEESRDLPGATRAEVLGRIARSAAAGNPEWARGLLDTALSLVREIREPAERVNPLIAIAEAYHQAKDDERPYEALERALSDLDRVWAQDTNAEKPNRALRDHWPSVQGCRMVMHSAAKILGAKSEALLPSIRTPDLALIARIQSARTLLGEPLDVHNIEIRW